MLIHNPTLYDHPLFVIFLVHVAVRQFGKNLVLGWLVLLPLQNFCQFLVRLMQLFSDEEAFIFLLLGESLLISIARELKVVTLHQRILLVENRLLSVSLRNV